MYHCVSGALYWLLYKADPIEPNYVPCAQNSKKCRPLGDLSRRCFENKRESPAGIKRCPIPTSPLVHIYEFNVHTCLFLALTKQIPCLLPPPNTSK